MNTYRRHAKILVSSWTPWSARGGLFTLCAILALFAFAVPARAQNGFVDRLYGVVVDDTHATVLTEPCAVPDTGGTRVEFWVYSFTQGGLVALVQLDATDEAQRISKQNYIMIPKRSANRGLLDGVALYQVTGRGVRTIKRGVPLLSSAVAKEADALILRYLKGKKALLRRAFCGDQNRIDAVLRDLDAIRAGLVDAGAVEMVAKDTSGADKPVVLPTSVEHLDVEAQELLSSCRRELEVANGHLAASRDIATAILAGVVPEPEIKKNLQKIATSGRDGDP